MVVYCASCAYSMAKAENNDASAVTRALQKFGIKKLRARLTKTKQGATQNAVGCLILQKNKLKPAKSSGYYHITIAESSDTANSVWVLVHHLVLACGSDDNSTAGVQLSLQSFPQENDWEEVSHLCNNKACLNPNHLFVERHSINLTRLCCVHFLHKHASFVCPHVPACIVNQ